MMRLRGLTCLWVVLGSAVFFVARGPRAAAEDAPEPLKELLAVIEKLQTDPAAVKGAQEELQKRAAELRQKLEAKKTDSEAAIAAKRAQLEELKKRVGELTAQLEAAKGELGGIEKELPEIQAKADEAAKSDPAGAARLDAIERSLKVLELITSAQSGGTTATLAAAPAPAPAPDSKITPEAAEFFETKIRPVLAENCFSCHGPEKQKSGLRLDSLAAALKGGETGAAIVAGKPDESLLIKAIRYDGELTMPPKEKLPQEAIDNLTEWVRMGAPWPESPKAAGDLAAAEPARDPREHWSFKPIQNPPVPEARDVAWPKTPLDNFILAKLDEKGLAPAAPTDKRTLLRRATLDLTGLNPTAEEIAAFETDDSPDAYEKVLDRLLASPAHGERWGRYWLDVARYADTKGYVFQEERRYPFSFAYRDYVIRSLNEDKPYDRFVMEQIAADQLDLGEDKKALAGMGFLTLGRRFLNNKNDVIDDRIDLISRGLMGLTASCARCHDHKFDPIPTADYYSLWGVFASSTEPADLPLIAEPDEANPQYQEYKTELASLESNVADYFKGKHEEFHKRYRDGAGDYLLAAQDGRKSENEDAFQAMARDRKLQHRTVRKWQGWLDERAKAFDPVLAPWFDYAALADSEYSTRSAELSVKIAANADAEKKINPVIARRFDGVTPANLGEVAGIYRAAFGEVTQHWNDLLTSHTQAAVPEGAEPQPAPTALPDADEEAVRQILFGTAAPGIIADGEVEQHMTLEEQAELRNRRLRVDGLKASHPGRPARAHVMVDAPKPVTPKVFKRGNPAAPGDEVPRQFFEILAGADRQPFDEAKSGRLDLAKAIASRDNPLTARVIVNRVWMLHFGRGLVTTPGDFGTRSDPPSHPEMLDWLATRFLDDGWSLKKLHRLIMSSAVYRQSSSGDEKFHELDPENRLLWHFNRRRLDFEGMRDSLLQVAGHLDSTMGGDSVEITAQTYSNRRSVYGFVERQNLPGLFRTFDFASPDTTSPQRFQTTVPQQALFLMNSPFALEQARGLAARAEAAAADPQGRVREMYRKALGREPSDEEVALMARFLEQQDVVETDPAEPRLWQYGYGKFDPAAGALAAFTPLPHWTGSQWQGGEKLPDPTLGWVSLNAKGGHPGATLDLAAVRRWTAPRDGAVRIRASARHDIEKGGDGIRVSIIHSAGGLVGSWIADHNKASMSVDKLPVKAGETLDFIVDCRTAESFDSFAWESKIEMIADAAKAAGQGEGETMVWDSVKDFAGPLPPALNPLEQLAQVILLSNEFMFVD